MPEAAHQSGSKMTSGAAHRLCYLGGDGDGGDLRLCIGTRWVQVGTLADWELARDMMGIGNTFTSSGTFGRYWVSAGASLARIRPCVSDSPNLDIDLVGTLCELSADSVTIINLKPWEGEP